MKPEPERSIEELIREAKSDSWEEHREKVQAFVAEYDNPTVKGSIPLNQFMDIIGNIPNPYKE